MFISKNTIYILALILFSLLLSLIPWIDILPKIYFEDRLTNMLLVESHANKILFGDYYNNFLEYFLNEWGWEYFLYITYEKMQIPFDCIFSFISFLSIFFSCLIMKKHLSPISIILLLNPWYMDFFYSQSRLALASSLIYFAFICRRWVFLSLLVILYALTVHTSIVVFLMIFLFTYTLKKIDINIKIKLFLSIIIGITLSLVTGPYFTQILATIGDRRAEVYETLDMSSSVSSMLPWIMLYLYILYLGYFFNLHNKFYTFYSIIILTLVFFNTVLFSGYTIRFLVAFYAIILISLLKNLRSYQRAVIICIYFFYTIFGWFLRFFVLWSE